MLENGLPETRDEAAYVVRDVATTTTVTPLHYPHAQIVALAQVVLELQQRVEKLEARRGPGRPPKVVEPVIEPESAPDLVTVG